MKARLSAKLEAAEKIRREAQIERETKERAATLAKERALQLAEAKAEEIASQVMEQQIKQEEVARRMKEKLAAKFA